MEPSEIGEMQEDIPPSSLLFTLFDFTGGDDPSRSSSDEPFSRAWRAD